MEIKECPKCGGEMKDAGKVIGLPRMTEKAMDPIRVREKGPEIEVEQAFAAELWSCMRCRFIELYAG